jgi:hypothetical protein
MRWVITIANNPKKYELNAAPKDEMKKNKSVNVVKLVGKESSKERLLQELQWATITSKVIIQAETNLKKIRDG